VLVVGCWWWGAGGGVLVVGCWWWGVGDGGAVGEAPKPHFDPHFGLCTEVEVKYHSKNLHTSSELRVELRNNTKNGQKRSFRIPFDRQSLNFFAQCHSKILGACRTHLTQKVSDQTKLFIHFFDCIHLSN
jgi:hypothetical protein